MKLRLIRLALVMLIAAVWHFGRSTNSASAPASTAAASATPKAAAKPYPFSTSLVSGAKLDGPDTVVKFVQDGYQIKLASQTEADTFKKTPAVYLAKIAQAYQTAKPCPLTACPVMGDSLDAHAYSFVYEGREFKFCCDGCMDDFEKDPAKYVKMWDDAEKAAQTAKQ